MKMWVKWVIFFLCPIINGGVQGVMLTDVLKSIPELSKFADLVRTVPLLNATLAYRQGTLFAPTNKAIEEFERNDGKMDNHTVLYHFCNVAKRTWELEDSISSELPGNPAIFITRFNDSTIYMNDAKIDLYVRNKLTKNAQGMDQVLHQIDRVLNPAVPDSSDVGGLHNPSALTFLMNSSAYQITRRNRISEFASRVAQLNLLYMYNTTDSGRNTYLVPIDEAFQALQKSSLDLKVVAAHVIPNNVIFLRPAIEMTLPTQRTSYPASSGAEFLVVDISFDKDGANKWIVKSDTKNTDGRTFHLKGVVQAEVVVANIPVKNGVIHLINKPLVVIHQTVYDYLAGEKQDGPTYEFFQKILEASPFFQTQLQTVNNRGIGQGGPRLTVFVPSAQAIKNAKLELLTSGENKTRLDEILRLHIVPDILWSTNITSAHERAPATAWTMSPTLFLPNNQNTPQYSNPTQQRNQLFFNYNIINGHTVLYVEGGGVNATITQPDIGATNGVIHLIDNVLGFADQTVYQKLKSDPMLQKTFELTSQDGFNLKLNSSMRFTLFAPNDLAWEKIYHAYPSEFKKLQMGNFGYHVARILERHMIVGRALTIEDMQQFSSGSSEYSFPIQAMHGVLRVENRHQTEKRLREEQQRYGNQGGIQPYSGLPNQDEYSVLWMDQRARVVRPNIVCTNGIVHVIDTVLMHPDDVSVGANYVASMSKSPQNTPHNSIFFFVMTTLTYFYIQTL